MDNKDTMYALGIVLMFIVFAIERVVSQQKDKRHEALVTQLADARSDKTLIDHAHTLAVDVVPADILRSVVATIDALAPLLAQIAPGAADVAKAAAALADGVASGQPDTPPPVA